MRLARGVGTRPVWEHNHGKPKHGLAQSKTSLEQQDPTGSEVIPRTIVKHQSIFFHEPFS